MEPDTRETSHIVKNWRISILPAIRKKLKLHIGQVVVQQIQDGKIILTPIDTRVSTNKSSQEDSPS